MSGQTRRPWSPEEDEAIRNIVQELGTKHWSEISQVMQDKYKLHGRSGKQCRERWHNHLAPEVNKRPWSKEEEEILFEAQKKFGNKWTEISKLIEGRTDNAIKNHFYSSIRRSLRRISKILGSKNSTVKMRSVKPAVLSAIFSLADREQGSSSQDYKDLASALIEFSRNRVTKQNSIAEEDKLGLENLINRLMQFSDAYQNDKKSNRKSPSGRDVFKNTLSIRNQSRKSPSECSQQQNNQNEDQQGPKEADSNLSQPSIGNGHIEDFEDNTRAKMSLEQSEYDWEEFRQRCETVVNKFMMSQNSLHSMENVGEEHGDHAFKKTPVKSERDTTLCSSSNFIGPYRNDRAQ